jgi:2-dehydro-3-deoxyphosphogluconate aldolase/(4S)-4-hydroxy-2-oxoglutarate aldolase
MKKPQLLEQFFDRMLVAIIRTKTPEPVVDIADALYAGGVRMIEVTLSVPGAIDAIAALSRRFADRAMIGVGTVLDAGSCQKAIEAGAQFVVSPHFNPEVVSATVQHGKISIPGTATPTEMLRAWDAGADVLKIFPSSGLGPNFVRDVLNPLPHLKLMPTGGVDPSNVAQWMAAGAVGVGAGASLVLKDAIERSDWRAIQNRAAEFVDAIAAARKS